MVRDLCLVLNGSVLEVLGEVFISVLSKLNFIFDGSSLADGCGGFAVAIGVDRCGGCCRC
jgi:hypothetical protein